MLAGVAHTKGSYSKRKLASATCCSISSWSRIRGRPTAHFPQLPLLSQISATNLLPALLIFRTALYGRCSQLSLRQVLEEPLAHQTAPAFSFDIRGKVIHFYFPWREPGCPLLTWPPVFLPNPGLAGLLNLVTSLTCIP